jgi:hypothetical protein
MKDIRRDLSARFVDKFGIYPRENRPDSPRLYWMDIGKGKQHIRVNFSAETSQVGLELLNAVGREYQGQGALCLAMLVAVLSGVSRVDIIDSERVLAINAVRLLYASRLEVAPLK